MARYDRDISITILADRQPRGAGSAARYFAESEEQNFADFNVAAADVLVIFSDDQGNDRLHQLISNGTELNKRIFSINLFRPGDEFALEDWNLLKKEFHKNGNTIAVAGLTDHEKPGTYARTEAFIEGVYWSEEL